MLEPKPEVEISGQSSGMIMKDYLIQKLITREEKKSEGDRI